MAVDPKVRILLAEAAEIQLHKIIMAKMPERVSSEHLVKLDKFSHKAIMKGRDAYYAGKETYKTSCSVMTNKGIIRFCVSIGVADAVTEDA